MQIKQLFKVVAFTILVGLSGNVTQAQEQVGEDEVVARVNGRVITYFTYRRALQDFLDEHKARVTVDERFEQEQKLGQRRVLQNLIELELLTQRAEVLSLEVEPAKLDQLLLISNEVCVLTSVDQVVRFPPTKPADKNVSRAALRQRLLADALLNQEVYQRVRQQLTDGQKRSYYEQHKEEFVSPGKVTLSRILIPRERDKERAEERALAIVAQLRNGSVDIARLEEEEDLEVNLLGTFKIPDLTEQLRTTMGNAPVGTITDPIKDGLWFTIFRLDSRQEPFLKPLEDPEVQQSVTEALTADLGRGQVQFYLATLRRQATIEINPNYQ